MVVACVRVVFCFFGDSSLLVDVGFMVVGGLCLLCVRYVVMC